MQLSHSKIQKYKQCPKRYDYYYNKKIRSKELSSSLFFGSAIDGALNILLLEKKKSFTKEESDLTQNETPQSILKKGLTEINYNGKDIILEDYDYLKFTKQDFDKNMFDDDEVEAFIEYYRSKRGKRSKEEIKRFNQINLESLYQKGLMIIDKYKEEVMPLIEEVYSIQERVSLPNDEGDELMGFIDFTCSFVDEPGVKYVVDNKTTSRKYTQDMLDESDQLSIYAEFKGYDKICYIAFEKVIRSRNPRVRYQIIRGDVNTDYLEKTFDNSQNVLLNIREGNFKKDYNSGCKFYGRYCEYYDICRKGKSLEEVKYLVDRKSKEKK